MVAQAPAPPLDLLPQLLHAGQAALAAVFALAAAGKLRDPGAFVAAVRGYAIVPRGAERPVAWAVIAAEGLLAASLLTGAAAGAAAFGGVALVGVMLAAVLVVLRRGDDVSCGCFGAADERVSTATALRLVALLAVASTLAVSWAASRHDPLSVGWIADHGAAGVGEAVVAAAVAAAALVLAVYAANGRALLALVHAQGEARAS